MGKNQGPWSSGRTRNGLRFQSDLRKATGSKHNFCCFWPATLGHSQFSVGSGELKAEVMMASVGTKGTVWGPGWSQSGGCRLELPMCPKGEPKGDVDSPVWARPQLLKSAQPWARVAPAREGGGFRPQDNGVSLHVLWKQPEYRAAENRNVLRSKWLKPQAFLLSRREGTLPHLTQ